MNLTNVMSLMGQIDLDKRLASGTLFLEHMHPLPIKGIPERDSVSKTILNQPALFYRYFIFFLSYKNPLLCETSLPTSYVNNSHGTTKHLVKEIHQSSYVSLKNHINCPGES